MDVSVSSEVLMGKEDAHVCFRAAAATLSNEPTPVEPQVDASSLPVELRILPCDAHWNMDKVQLEET